MAIGWPERKNNQIESTHTSTLSYSHRFSTEEAPMDSTLQETNDGDDALSSLHELASVAATLGRYLFFYGGKMPFECSRDEGMYHRVSIQLPANFVCHAL